MTVASLPRAIDDDGVDDVCGVILAAAALDVMHVIDVVGARIDSGALLLDAGRLGEAYMLCDI